MKRHCAKQNSFHHSIAVTMPITDWFVYDGDFGLNPFWPIVPFIYPWKRQKNPRFSDIFMVNWDETLA